jgi:iron(III) transport system ATP-binding protein
MQQPADPLKANSVVGLPLEQRAHSATGELVPEAARPMLGVTNETRQRNPPPDIAVRIRDGVKRFGTVSAANGVSFELEKGQLMALLGPSGCGKTTTLRLVAGFERLDSGVIEIGAKQVAGPGIHIPPERRSIGMVFQEYALFPHLSVDQNVSFGLHQYGGDKRKRVDEVLELVGMSGLGRRMPHELSGGQQQRVALARALAPNPELVLLDEPFSNLDAGLRVRVRSEVRQILRQAGATAIFVTHDQEEALSLVDVVAVLVDGIVRQVASPQKLYRQPADKDVAAFLGDANFLPGKAHGRQVDCEVGTLELISEAQGSVDVLIRPESIHVMPASAESPCRVRSILFFGHDQLVTLQLGSGTQVDARLGPLYHFAVGQPVQVKVEGPVMAYPH